MNMNELRQKSKEELIGLMREKRSRIDDLHFLLRMSKVKNVKEIAALKKDIARVQTVISSLPA